MDPDQLELDAPAVETPPPGEPDKLAVLQQELDGLKSAVAEQTRNAQYWHDKATAAPAKEPVVAAAPVPEEEDLLDLMATKGQKGLAALLDKLGYARKDEVQETVNQRTAALTAEAQLVKQYPELDDKTSEFFLATAQAYGELRKNGVSEILATRLAAESTELKFMRTGKMKTPGQIADDAKTAKETERRERIRAQSGDRGSRASRADPDESDDLTPEQKNVAIRMLAHDGVTAEQAIEKYKARAKVGVAVRGGMR